MTIYETGRVCMKIAGRDAGKLCAVIGENDEGDVLIDGRTRRRHVNPDHLEPLNRVLDVDAEADADEIEPRLPDI